jgi:hypothetical protein
VSAIEEDAMRIRSTPFRTIARVGSCLALFAAAIAALAAIPSATQNKGGCPEIIAALLPKNGSIRGGQYTAGPMGMGGGSADLPFEHPCTKSEKYPARVSVAVTYYGGEMAELLKMQGDAANQQTLESALGELKTGQRSPVREKLDGGEIVYVAYETECQPETIDTGKQTKYPPTPHVKLKGVALTANVRLEVDLEGKISLDVARAAVAEVFENLKKADFEKAK